jgi:hypothetical protein
MTLFAADSTFSGLHDFFHSQTWHATVAGTGIVVGVFWLAVGFWVNKDARRRISNPWVVGLATLLGLVPPFLGALVYMLFRPPEYLQDVRERDLEIKAMEDRLSLRAPQCPVCRAEVEPSFLVCPVCTTRLKQACVTCGAPLEARWQVCPHCETPIVEPSPSVDGPLVEAPRRSRRSSSK